MRARPSPPALFLAAAILVSLLSAGASLTLLSRGQDDAAGLAANEARLLTNDLLQSLQAKLPTVDAWDREAEEIAARAAALGAVAEIVDLEGRVVFDSSDPGGWQRGRIVAIPSYVNFDRSFVREHPGLVRIAFPLMQGERQAGNAVFTLPSRLLTPAGQPAADIALLPALGGLGVLCLLSAFLARYVAARVVQPIGLLTRQARTMAAGDLDSPVPAAGTGEIRALQESFDALRDVMRHALATLETSEKARREFVASVSHELRTPLSSIRAYVEGIQDGIARDPAAVGRYLAVIRQKADALAGLIDDLFQQSLADIDRLPVEPQEVYSGDMLRRIVEPLLLQYREDPVRFRVEAPLPNVLVRADERRIEQVVLNLVQNARRNTPAGGSVSIAARVAAGTLEVSVADTGRGISEEELPFVFERFFRGGGQGRDTGSGIGLSLCRYIVEKHGGSIRVTSGQGQGTTFTISLPKL
jgi:signal transduction histidine kinase